MNDKQTSPEQEQSKPTVDADRPTEQEQSKPAAQAVDPFDNNFADYQAILAPISADDPCGDGNAQRYEAQYEAIEAEINKLVVVTKNVVVDWGKLKNLTGDYLTCQAIDLLVACYFCYALFAVNGYQGLGSGLAVLSELITRYWDNMFPALKRMSGRVAAVEWLIERLRKGFEKRKPNAQEIKNMDQLRVGFDTLEQQLEQRMADSAPDFSVLQRIVREHVASFQRMQSQAEQQRKKDEKNTGAGGRSGTGGEEIPTEIQADADVENVLGIFETVMANIAAFYRNKDLSDPRAFHFNRYGTWLPIDALPPDQEGLTRIGGPRSEAIGNMEAELDDGNYKNIVKELEEGLANSPFWLGSQRLLCQALDRLGGGYVPCKIAVQDQVAMFVRRLPKIFMFKFADGTPFIDEKTKGWIEADVLGAMAGGGVGGGAMVGGAEDAPWLEVAKEAKAAALEGDFAEGLKLFKIGQGAAASKRENFIWRIYQSRYSLDAGQLELAIGQLESLDKQVRQLGLDEWEPQLSVEVARLLLLCYSKYIKKTQKSLPGVHDKMEDLYRRICRLDINVALSIEDKPWQE